MTGSYLSLRISTLLRTAATRLPIGRFDVYSYTTRVAVVNRDENDNWDTFVHRDAFHHTTTTSKHVRRFVSAMVGRVDWDALYKACNKACDDETINGYSNPWINVREVA